MGFLFFEQENGMAGTIVLSLGYQNLQIKIFKEALGTINPNPKKPVLMYEQQQMGAVKFLNPMKTYKKSAILAERMPDIIDVDTGPVIRGEKSIEEMDTLLMEYIIAVASGEKTAKADMLGQDDFIPWKRGVSL